jgi:hypothetical protein
MFELDALESGHVATKKIKPLSQKEGFAFVKALVHLIVIAPTNEDMIQQMWVL